MCPCFFDGEVEFGLKKKWIILCAWIHGRNEASPGTASFFWVLAVHRRECTLPGVTAVSWSKVIFGRLVDQGDVACSVSNVEKRPALQYTILNIALLGTFCHGKVGSDSKLLESKGAKGSKYCVQYFYCVRGKRREFVG